MPCNAATHVFVVIVKTPNLTYSNCLCMTVEIEGATESLNGSPFAISQLPQQ